MGWLRAVILGMLVCAASCGGDARRESSRYIVRRVAAGAADAAGVSDVLKGVGRKLTRLVAVGGNGYQAMEVDARSDVETLVQHFRKHGLTAEEDHVQSASVVPNDMYVDSMWNLVKISAPSAWDVSTGAGKAAVCVIDTGMDYTHPDLAANVASKGYNAISGALDAFDDNGHGTHCSGTIGAVANNARGIVGVVWSVRLIGCKFLDAGGSGYTSDAIRCLKFCRGAGARITSNSWGGGQFSQALHDEIVTERAAGNLFVTAAGNANLDIDVADAYPANYDVDNVVVVSATGPTDARSAYSNYGYNNVDLGAPGDNIYSTVPNASYASLSGTSMATPHVAGAAALLWDRTNMSASYLDIKRALLDSADRIGALSGYSRSGGRLNVSRALEYAAPGRASPPLPPLPPLPRLPPLPPYPPRQACCKYNKLGRCIKAC